MRVPPTVLTGNLSRSPLVVMGFMILFAGAAYKSAGYVIAGDMVGLAYVAMALIACAFILVILNNWRNGLYFFLIWLLFEDFARNNLGNNLANFLPMDVLTSFVILLF